MIQKGKKTAEKAKDYLFQQPSTFETISQMKRWETCQNKMVKLLQSERNAKISRTFNGTAFTVDFRDRHTLYRGIKERLKERIWPDTEENPLKRDRKDVERRKDHELHSNKKGKAKDCKAFGSAHGEMVHNEMEIYCTFITEKKPQDWLNQNLPDPDPCTARIISALDNENLIPIRSEFMIWDEDWRVATSIDMLAYDYKKYRFVLIEFKTGYENEIYGPHPTDEPLPKPFHQILNCPLIRHQMQLFGMIRMIKRKYKIMMDGAYLIRVCPKSNGTQILGLCDWFNDKNNQENFDMMMMDSNR
jgi:hypothetical protein